MTDAPGLLHMLELAGRTIAELESMAKALSEQVSERDKALEHLRAELAAARAPA